MKSLPYLLVIVLSVGLVFVYFHKPSGIDQRLIKLDHRYMNVIDSLQSAYNELITKKDSAALQAFKSAQEAANRYEVEAVIWKGKYEKEKRNNRHFSDVTVDSILSTIH